MLAVGIERDDRRATLVERVSEPSPQGGALAGVGVLDEDGRAGRLGLGGGVVGGAVVDHDDGEEGPRLLHDGSDARALLVARDQREDGVHA